MTKRLGINALGEQKKEQKRSADCIEPTTSILRNPERGVRAQTGR